jgi:hypothetical protein
MRFVTPNSADMDDISRRPGLDFSMVRGFPEAIAGGAVTSRTTRRGDHDFVYRPGRRVGSRRSRLKIRIIADLRPGIEHRPHGGPMVSSFKGDVKVFDGPPWAEGRRLGASSAPSTTVRHKDGFVDLFNGSCATPT